MIEPTIFTGRPMTLQGLTFCWCALSFFQSPDIQASWAVPDKSIQDVGPKLTDIPRFLTPAASPLFRTAAPCLKAKTKLVTHWRLPSVFLEFGSSAHSTLRNEWQGSRRFHTGILLLNYNVLIAGPWLQGFTWTNHSRKGSTNGLTPLLGKHKLFAVFAKWSHVWFMQLDSLLLN